MGLVDDMKAKLFVRKSFVCGGHGARRPKHGRFTVPNGITIYFYIADTVGLPNSVGQQVDRILHGQAGSPTPTETLTAGQVCHNYHLYSPRNGGYLTLASSSVASNQYITTKDSADGIALKAICDKVLKIYPVADIHWSACRSVEGDNDQFPDTLTPTFTGRLATVATLGRP